jgi:hypothetical protein
MPGNSRRSSLFAFAGWHERTKRASCISRLNADGDWFVPTVRRAAKTKWRSRPPRRGYWGISSPPGLRQLTPEAAEPPPPLICLASLSFNSSSRCGRSPTPTLPGFSSDFFGSGSLDILNSPFKYVSLSARQEEDTETGGG